ncbi:MAG: cytochrome b N-terminal domain-containing protein [Chloroflexi bacterium]|nr:cytochrome b N-terminal domain-containing protein [Chloroflexota bacterium]
MATLYHWLHERIELVSLRDALFTRLIPVGVGFWYTLGFASIFVFINQVLTGMVLSLYYSPSPDHAYDSVNYIMNEVTFGSVVRGLHHWGASAMVVLVVAHGAVVFAMAAYKYPRELTWIIGILTFLVVLGFSFTGYLLPWDEKAYWATTVGTNMAGTVPYVGDYLVRVLRGGSTLGAMTLARFYVAHTMILPAIFLVLIGIHLFLVVRIGVSVPPKLWEGNRQSRPAAGGRRP